MKSILKKLLFVGMVTIIGFSTISLPVQSYASAESNIINNSPINMIKQTDSELIYEVEANGEILRYEEQIKEDNDKTKIETKVYKIIDGEKKLVDDSKKEIIKTESQIEFIKNDESLIVNLDEFTGTTTEILKSESEFSTFAYGSWVKSVVPGINLGYRRDLSANYGDASYSTMTKQKVKLNNTHFDTFRSKVDALKSRESAFLLEATAIAAITQLVKKGFSGWSLADIISFLRKLAVPVNVIWNVGYWLWDYNGAINSWNDIPGSIKYGCNWSC